MRLFAFVLCIIFSFTVSSGAAMVCCINIDDHNHQVEENHMDTMMEDCHNSLKKQSVKHESDSDKQSDEDECCENFSLCELQIMQNDEHKEINKDNFSLLLSDYFNNFISNITEPLKEPPKSLL